jgi:hypothetical protein
MIELTEEQRRCINDGNAVRVQGDGHEYVVLRPDVYDRLAREGFDTSPWEPEELDRLREESVTFLDRFGKGS